MNEESMLRAAHPLYNAFCREDEDDYSVDDYEAYLADQWREYEDEQ